MCSWSNGGHLHSRRNPSWKLVDKFTYLGSRRWINRRKDIETRLTKAWTAINRLSIIWKSDLTDKMKRSFFLAAVTSILLYGCTTWTLTKRLEKKLDGKLHKNAACNLEQVPAATPHKTPTVRPPASYHENYSSLDEPDTQDTAEEAGDELIRDVLLWTPTRGRAKAGRPARTYIQQLCEDTGCCPWRTCLGRWTIGGSGERGSGISVLPSATWCWMMMSIGDSKRRNKYMHSIINYQILTQQTKKQKSQNWWAT